MKPQEQSADAVLQAFEKKKREAREADLRAAQAIRRFKEDGAAAPVCDASPETDEPREAVTLLGDPDSSFLGDLQAASPRVNRSYRTSIASV